MDLPSASVLVLERLLRTAVEVALQSRSLSPAASAAASMHIAW